MANDNVAPVAIIGYGTAGVNAAIALRNAGYAGGIDMFSDIDTLPYSPILTSYYAGGEKSYEECFPWSEDELGELCINVVQEGPVIKLDPEEHAIETREGAHRFSKCVIATGATPVTNGFPAVEGDEDYEPIVLRTLEDAQLLKDALSDESCKRVLVSGASMVALKTLEACLNTGKECSLVGMNPHVLDFNALPEVAERFERGLEDKDVSLHLGQTIASVKRASDGLHVTFSSGDVGVYDLISVSHGMKSNLGFVKPGSLDIDKGVIVDERMRSSHPDVYAAGDVAQGTELISGEKRIVGIWKNAALQGACAGACIAAELAGKDFGDECSIKGFLSSNTIVVDDLLFISAGTIEVTPERRVEFEEFEDMTVARIFQDDPNGSERLVGFNIACDHDEPGGLAYDIGAMLTLRIQAACGL